MSVSSEADPEGGERSAGVAGVAAQRGGEVDRPRPTELADDQVAQGRHDVWGGAGADLGAVLGEGGVADVVQRLDGPVPTDEVGQAGGAGLGVGEAGDGLDRHGRAPPGMVAQVAGGAGDLEDLGGVGEPEMVDRDGLEGAELDAAVAAVAGAVQLGDQAPGKALAAVQQGGLVGLDHE